MKRRFIAKGALLCFCALLCRAVPAAAQEMRLGDYIYVPAMTVSASGTISLRVEGLALGEDGDQPQEIGALSGAEFGVYVISGDGELTPWANPLYPSEPMRIRTGEGETSFSLPSGAEFYLRQERAPQGYVCDQETLIPVTGEEIVVKNAMEGELLLSAVDTTGAPLAGVVMQVTADDGSAHTLITDEHGEAVLSCDQAQGYTIMESELPEGVFAARAVSGAQQLPAGVADSLCAYAQAELAYRTRVVFEHPASGSVQLAMTLGGHDGFGEPVKTPLSGVRMDISQNGTMIASITTDEAGAANTSLLEGVYDVSFSYDGDEDVYLPLDQGQMLVSSGATTQIDLTAVPVTGRVRVSAQGAGAVQGGSVTLAGGDGNRSYGPYAFDAEGMAVSDPLPEGVYHVSALELPQGTSFGGASVAGQAYDQIESALMTVEGGALAHMDIELLTRRQQSFALLIREIDDQGKTQLRAMEEPISLVLTDEDRQSVQHLDVVNGEVNIDALSGRYTLSMDEEEAASLNVLPVSEAFDLPSAQDAVVFASDRARLILSACDQDGTPVSGAVYSVTDASGSSFEVVCDADGMAVTPAMEPGYARISTLIAPEGYDMAQEAEVLAQAGDAVNVHLEHPAYGEVRIAVRMQRLNEQGQTATQPLPGMNVYLYRVAQDGAQMTDTGMELIADEQGEVTVSLMPGEYVARVDAQELAGGCREAQALRFSIDNEQSIEGELLCMDALGGVRVQLIGGELADDELAQVRFELTNAQGGVIEMALEDGGFYAGALSAGAYVLRQTQMPAGYALARERTITVSGGEVTPVDMPLEEYAVVSVMKTGLTFDDSLRTYVVPLSGAYGVYTQQDGGMKPYPSADAQAIVWANVTQEQIAAGMADSVKLPAQAEGTTYYLREMNSVSGFAADETYHEALLHAGERRTMSFAVSSDRGFFTLEQKDAGTGGHVPGGAYELIDALSGETVLAFEIGDEPYSNPMAIPVGQYRLRHVRAAEGYALSVREEDVIVEPYLTQGGAVTSVMREVVQIPQDERLAIIADVYAARQQGLNLLCVDSASLPAGETLAAPVMELRVQAQGGERTNIASLVLSGASDAQGGAYMARIEYELAGGGWQPSDARMTGVIAGPTAVSLADITDDVSAVRITYLNAQTGEEFAGNGFTPGQVTLSVQGSAQGELNMQASVSFGGTFVYRTDAQLNNALMARMQREEMGFTMEGDGLFERVCAGRDGSISGVAFFDEDADGVMDQNETGRYAGMTVSLITEAGDTVASARTDASGRYAFDSISSGVYRMQFDGGERVVFSSGSLYSDHVISGVRDTRYGMSDALVIDGDHTDYVVQAGCIFASEIAGVVLERMSAQEAVGFGGLNIEMRAIGTGMDDEPLLVMSGDTGEFGFARVLPGEYSVRIALPQGFLSKDAQDGVIEKRFTLAAGETMAFDPIYIQREAAIYGSVRIDDDGDGLIADGALGLGGVSVALLRAEGGNTERIAETITDAQGGYAFEQLELGEYSVLFELNGEWAFTRFGGDSAVYGAVSQSGSTKSFALEPGSVMSGVNAGVTIPAQMSVSVFKDTQYDGQKGAYEEMLPDVQISLIRLENGEDAEEMTYRTGEDGTIVFAGVSPGEYVIAYQMPGQWRATKQIDSSSSNYPTSAVAQSTNNSGRSEPFTLSMGQSGVRMYIGAMLSGSISGVVYYDDDADAYQGENELPVQEMTVELLGAADGAVLHETKTQQDGSYAFEGLAPGRYRVRFTAEDGCGFSGTERTAARGGVLESDENVSMTRAITVDSGVSEVSADAGVVRLGSLSGFVWEDSSADRVRDEGEKAMPGLTVCLMDGAGRSILASCETDESGAYLFPALRPGSYKLRVDAPQGYVFSGGVQDGALHIESERSGRGYSTAFALLGGAHVQNLGFGLLTQGTISGLVWEDSDYDAMMTEGENGLRGAVIALVDQNGAQVGRTQSLRTGEFAFSELMPGEYSLHVTLMEGFAFTADGGMSAAAHDAEYEALIPLGYLAMGGSIEGVRIGALKTASVSGTVWLDQDDDGRRQAGDAGVEGVIVRLEMLSGADAGKAYEKTIGAEGTYRFDGMMPGQAQLTFTVPQGHAFARRLSGTRRVSVVPSENALTACTDIFDITAGDILTDYDAGVVGVGTVSGMIWEDSAYDGQYGSSERGVAGAVVELIDAKSGAVAGMGETDETGAYAIGFARMGEYTVRVTLPEGMIFTRNGEGAIADADTRTAQTAAFSLAMGEGRGALNAGAIIPASLSGRLVLDENGDGLCAEGETGYAGAVVTAMQGGTVISTVRTDETGAYTLDMLRPGDYRLRFALGDEGLFAHGAQLNLTHADASEGETAECALSMAQNLMMEAVPVVRAAKIGGRAWMDADVSGTIDDTEAPMEGILVELLSEQGSVLSSMRTDASGGYAFDRLREGRYALRVSLDDEVLFTNQSGEAGGSCVPVAEGNTGETEIFALAMGEQKMDMNVGGILPGAIGDSVWLDTNGNGLQDYREPLITGVGLTLLSVTGDGSMQEIAQTASDRYGYYMFESLRPGSYVLRVELLEGDTLTFSFGEPLHEIDSNIDPETGVSGVIELMSGQTLRNVDVGFTDIEKR